MARKSKDDNCALLITRAAERVAQAARRAGRTWLRSIAAATTRLPRGQARRSCDHRCAGARAQRSSGTPVRRRPSCRRRTSRKILVVLQGMDTSGKGGVIRHAIGMVDPQGVKIKAFKAPTEEERAHPYLWRIERELPPPGMIGIFDRSQYEDVLVVRVNNLVDESVWSQALRRDQRLGGRLGRPRHGVDQVLSQSSPRPSRRTDCWPAWTIRPSTGSTTPAMSTSGPSGLRTWRPTKRYWSACNTERAPWYVIPADRKWYRNWAVAQLLGRAPARTRPAAGRLADFDVENEKERVAAS